MASAFVPSYELTGTTTMRLQVLYAGADVAGGTARQAVNVTGLDFANDTANQIATKIAAAIRAATSELANGTGTAGFTVATNQIVMPAFTKG